VRLAVRMKGPPAERADPREGGKSRSTTDPASGPHAALASVRLPFYRHVA
jgi:hypothetical protein